MKFSYQGNSKFISLLLVASVASDSGGKSGSPAKSSWWGFYSSKYTFLIIATLIPRASNVSMFAAT